VPAIDAQIMIALALLLGTPFFIVFGWLSDKVGRKPIMLAGFALGALTYFPIFQGITHFANPALEAAQASAPVTVVADPNECSFQLKLTGTETFTSSCDIAKSALVAKSVNYDNTEAPPGTPAQVRVGETVIESFSAAGLPPDEAKARTTAFTDQLTAATTAAGYPASADPAQINRPMTILLLWILVIYVTLVYAPIAAWLVELFPTRIRYTGMSLPYHIGTAVRRLPAGDRVRGRGGYRKHLFRPLVPDHRGGVQLRVMLLFLPETKDRDITSWTDAGQEPSEPRPARGSFHSGGRIPTTKPTKPLSRSGLEFGDEQAGWIDPGRASARAARQRLEAERAVIGSSPTRMIKAHPALRAFSRQS
jgi:hypothetical protein